MPVTCHKSRASAIKWGANISTAPLDIATPCWHQDWLIGLDIKGFFDNLDQELLMRAVRHHTDLPWVILYVQRWLTAPVQHADGRLEERTKGSPQGSVISPVLANLFLHYAFDEWMRRNHPHVLFERYAEV